MNHSRSSTDASIRRSRRSGSDVGIKHTSRNSTDMSSIKREGTRLFTRCGTFVLQRGVEEGMQGELEELRRKNRLLQEQVKRTKHQPEKPYEEMQAKEAQVSVRVFRKWNTLQFIHYLFAK